MAEIAALGLQVVGMVMDFQGNREAAQQTADDAVIAQEEAQETINETTADAGQIISDIEEQRKQLLNQQAALHASSNVISTVGSPLELAVETNEVLDDNIQRVRTAHGRAVDDLMDIIMANQRAIDRASNFWNILLGSTGSIVGGAQDIFSTFEKEVAPDVLETPPELSANTSNFQPSVTGPGITASQLAPGLFQLLQGL